MPAEGVEIRRASIDVNGQKVDGWVAEYDGTQETSVAREGALKQLVKAVAQEAL